MIITNISDIHWKYDQIPKDKFPGGDLLICAGDITGYGYKHELQQFCKFFARIPNYKHRVFIGGNHDFFLDEKREESLKVISKYKSLTYLLDESHLIYDEVSGKNIELFGSPQTPAFREFVFMYPRNGTEAQKLWESVPDSTDILITHTPPFGIMDIMRGSSMNLGCEVLDEQLKRIKPKIHVFGHIHDGHGYVSNGITHFINAAQLDGRYEWTNSPLTVDWNPTTNTIEFILK